jgi:hypothetical protein
MINLFMTQPFNVMIFQQDCDMDSWNELDLAVKAN